jgi:hypothetical protein
VALVVRVVGLEFAVGPEGLEVRFGTGKEVRLTALRELDGPLDAIGQRSARQVGAADVGGAEAARTPEQPGLGMQPGAPAIERDANLATRQRSQGVDRIRFRSAGVGCGKDPDRHRRAARPALTKRSKHVNYLAHATRGDEADEDVQPIAAGDLLPQFVQQARCAGSGREQARCDQPLCWRWQPAVGTSYLAKQAQRGFRARRRIQNFPQPLSGQQPPCAGEDASSQRHLPCGALLAGLQARKRAHQLFAEQIEQQPRRITVDRFEAVRATVERVRDGRCPKPLMQTIDKQL